MQKKDTEEGGEFWRLRGEDGEDGEESIGTRSYEDCEVAMLVREVFQCGTGA